MRKGRSSCCWGATALGAWSRLIGIVRSRSPRRALLQYRHRCPFLASSPRCPARWLQHAHFAGCGMHEHIGGGGTQQTWSVVWSRIRLYSELSRCHAPLSFENLVSMSACCNLLALRAIAVEVCEEYSCDVLANCAVSIWLVQACRHRAIAGSTASAPPIVGQPQPNGLFFAFLGA